MSNNDTGIARLFAKSVQRPFDTCLDALGLRVDHRPRDASSSLFVERLKVSDCRIGIAPQRLPLLAQPPQAEGRQDVKAPARFP